MSAPPAPPPFLEIRKQLYEHNYWIVPHIADWRSNPYTFVKSLFYLELATVVVFLSLKSGITANTVTIAYGFAGILGGVLLSIPHKWTIFAALLIFFTKSSLDWADGIIARLNRQSSLTGHTLDIYGAHLNALGFQMGVGFYVAQKSGDPFFFYLIPLIPFFLSTGLTNFGYHYLFDFSTETALKKILQGKESPTARSGGSKKPTGNGESRWKRYAWLTGILDDRARSVDFVMLLIVLEYLYPPFFVTWIIFLLFVIRGFIIFAGKFYLVVNNGWIENQLQTKLQELKEDH